jgi:DNA-binding protein YbaB
MGDADQPTMADVMQILQTLTANMSQMQSDMAGMQAKLSSTSESSNHHDG